MEMQAHAESLEEALRTKILGLDGRRDAQSYREPIYELRLLQSYLIARLPAHYHPGAPATPFPRSPPNERASSGEDLPDAIAGQDAVSQSSSESVASAALPGAHTTSAGIPLGAETVHLPESILPHAAGQL